MNLKKIIKEEFSKKKTWIDIIKNAFWSIVALIFVFTLWVMIASPIGVYAR